MIDYDVLASVGTTNERLRIVFTAAMPGNADELPEEERKAIEKDIATRTYWETQIRDRLEEHINFNLKNQALWAAVDLAMDAAPINKTTYPLVLLAQGKLDKAKCIKALRDLGCREDYITKDDKGDLTIDLPKFLETEVNIIRSFVRRRLAAQRSKYNSLYPYLKYESRSTSLVGKLRADAWSQQADIMADQFDYRHHDEQVDRDMLLYGHSVDFVRAAWEKETQWARKEPIPGLNSPQIEKEAVTVKEGVVFVNPHPSRVFWDSAYPLSSINADIGCEYIGYWDIIPYRAAKDNPDYFNKDKITFSTGFVNLFSTYSTYFTQYYDRIKVPTGDTFMGMPALENDRVSNIGRYASNEGDAAMLLAVYHAKLVPKDWGVGEYPFPVWVRFIWAGNGTVVFAEILPSTPATYEGLDENDSRRVNLSFAMELMPYQDQMTNLVTQLLAVCKQEQVKVFSINTDGMDPVDQKKLQLDLQGKNYFVTPLIHFYSASKAAALGTNAKPIDLCQPQSNAQSITFLFQAITRLIELVERLESMSPNESGQPIVRGNGGVSATEASQIEGTTTAVYSFISDAIDQCRAAKKRILYESFMAKAGPDIRVPVLNRYPLEIIAKAGFTPWDEDGLVAAPQAMVLKGKKSAFLHDYIFSSRDGAERESNVQTATTLVQLVPLLTNPVLMAKLTTGKFFEIINEIFRKCGAGVDLDLQADPGEADQPIGQEQETELQQIVARLMGIVEQNSNDIKQMQEAAARLMGGSAPAANSR